MSNDFISGLLISIISSLLGVNLVLRRLSMLGDGLSHVGFGACAVASVMGVSLLGFSLPVVILVAFAIIFFKGGDSSVALWSSGALAVGAFLLSSEEKHEEFEELLFGSYDSLSGTDFIGVLILSVVVALFFIFFYKNIFRVTFDEGYAKATGEKVGLIGAVIAFLTAVTIVYGMRCFGALLISSLVVFPPMTAMRLCKSFKMTILVSVVVAAVCYCVGVAMAEVAESAVGPTVVIANIAVYAFALCANAYTRTRSRVD
jgi:zinc transport system permease protein